MNNNLQILKGIILAVVFVFGISFVSGDWREPVSAPPGDNAPAPLNVSRLPQDKSGPLRVVGFRSFADAIVDGKLGLGTVAPTEKLEVVGKIKIVDGTQGAGRVLISDENGVAKWSELSGEVVAQINRFGDGMWPENAPVLPSGTRFRNDSATPTKLCEIGNFGSASATDGRAFSSPKNNNLVYWNGQKWITENAKTAGNNGLVALTCQKFIFKLSR